MLPPVASPSVKPTATATPMPSMTSTATSSASPTAVSSTATPTGSPTSQVSSTPTPVPTPSPIASAQAASAHGKLVDSDTNLPIGGENVGIAPFFRGASLNRVAVTAIDGSFSFTTAPGKYLLVIGMNSTNLGMTTFHGPVSLNTGDNPLAQGVPIPNPQKTNSPAQASGAYRLISLGTTEQECLNAVNDGRLNSALPFLIPDESAYEEARSYSDSQVKQATASPMFSPNPAFADLFGYYSSFVGSGYANCTAYAETYSFGIGNPPNSAVINPRVVWYAGEYATTASNNFAVQVELVDPRP